MAKKQIKNYIFEPGISKDANLFPNAVALLTANKAFIIAQEIAFINYNIANNVAPYVNYTYAPEKCQRDVGYYLDAIIHDLRYGGNVKIRMIADYFWIDGMPQIRNGAVPEVTAQQYMRDLINNFIFTNTTVTQTYGQTAIQQVKFPGAPSETGASSKVTSEWTILGNVIQQGLRAMPAKQTGVSSIRLLGNYDTSELLLITDANSGKILYNFSDPSNTISLSYKSGNSSGNGKPLSDVDFRAWYNTTDTITTILFSQDTTNLNVGSAIQVFVEEPSQQIRPWEFGTDAIERMRVAAPQAMLDADFEYGLQPTKWQALALQRSYPSLYEIPGTDQAVIAVSTDASSNSGGFGSSLITVTTSGTHGFSVGTPITIRGLSSGTTGFSRAEGSYLIYSVPTPYTFTYYASSKVGVFNGDNLYTSYVQLRQAGFYTGASIGTPTFSVYSNGGNGTILTTFNTPSGETNLPYSGSAPTVGSPVSGSPGIYPGTSISGVVGSATVAARVKTTVTLGQTYIDIVDLTGVQPGMAVDAGSSTSRIITSIQGNRCNLDGAFNTLLLGADGVSTNVAGSNVQPKGVNARFNIARAGGTYSVTGRIDSSSNGQNYAVGDQILILGTALGGVTPANDLVITVASIDSGGSILTFTSAGVGSDGSATYNTVTQTSTTGGGSGFAINVARKGGTGVYTVSFVQGGIGYQPGDDVVFAGTSFGGTAPTNNIVIQIQSVDSNGSVIDWAVTLGAGVNGNATYAGIAGTNVTPTGAGAYFNITRTSGVYSATIYSPGISYRLGNSILVTGNLVGGAAPLNNVLLTVTGVDTNGGVTSASASGTTIIGDPITVYPTITLSDATIDIISSGTVLNVGAIATIQVSFPSNHGLVPGASILSSITSLPTPAFSSAQRALPTSGTWTGIAFSGGKFVALLANSTTSAFSINGTAWQSGGTLPGSVAWSSVAAGVISSTTYFVAVATGTQTGAYSTNNGQSWTSMSLPQSGNWTSVCFYNGKFIAIQSGSQNTAVSSNGTSWTAGGTTTASTTWTSITGGLIGTLAYYVAIASGGTVANYSYDGGATWQATGVLPASATWSAITYGNSRFLAIASGSATAAYSTDGTTWISSTLPSSTTWNAVTFGDDNFVVVATSTSSALTSFTGATGSWTPRTLATAASWGGIAYGNYSGVGIFALTGNSTNGLSIALASANHSLASGPFIVSQVPDFLTIRFPARTTGTIDTSGTSLAGSIYSRPDAFFQHRPFDGGVQLGTGGPQHGAQAVRQSKKYIRYQSGKGIMYTTGALFAPSYNLSSATASGKTVNSLITFVTDDTDHGLQPGGIIEITGMNSFEYNNTYTVESVRDSRTFRVRTAIPLNATTGTLGPDAKVTVKGWHGATIRSGPFDDQNGIFYQYDGQTLSLGKRSSTFQLAGIVTVQPNSNSITGTLTRFQDQMKVGDRVVLRGMSHTITSISDQTTATFSPDYRGNSAAVGAKLCLTIDTLVPQGQWNMDNGDGTGPSGYNINPGKMQMIGIQYSWYAAGFIEFMLRGADGKFVFLHRIRNSNINTEAYMRSANLPVRYEVENVSARTYLRTAMGSSDTTMTVGDTSYFPSAGTIYIDNELITYTSKNSNQLLGLSRGTTFSNFAAGSNRTYSAGVASSHTAGTGFVLISCTISPAISHWGSAILTDGRFDDDRGYLFNYSSTNISVSTTKTTAFLIRLAPSVSNAIVGDLGDRELLNRAQLLLQEIVITADALSGGAIGGLVVEGVLNPQNYPSDPSTVQWIGLNGVSQGGQPSFAQIAPGGNVNWSSGAQQTTKTVSTASTNSQVKTNFLYIKQASWEASQAKVGTEVQDPTKFPAGTRVSSVTGPAEYVAGNSGLEYLVYFTQNSVATIAGDTNITFVFGQPPYALPGEQVFSFICNAGDQTQLDLSQLKELTSTSIGGRGTYPNGPDVLAINVYKVAGTSTNANIILRWSEAQA